MACNRAFFGSSIIPQSGTSRSWHSTTRGGNTDQEIFESPPRQLRTIIQRTSRPEGTFSLALVLAAARATADCGGGTRHPDEWRADGKYYFRFEHVYPVGGVKLDLSIVPDVGSKNPYVRFYDLSGYGVLDTAHFSF